MIRIHLDDNTRDELKALRRTDLPHKVRDCIEMVALSDAGWSAPRIAGHLGCHPQTVRDLPIVPRPRHRRVTPLPRRAGPRLRVTRPRRVGPARTAAAGA